VDPLLAACNDLAGLREFIAAMDDRRIDDQADFTDILVTRARADETLLAELRHLADAGGAVARGILADATRVTVDPRDALAEQLRRQVFLAPR